MDCKAEEYVRIVSLTWDESLILYNLNSLSKVRVERIAPDSKLLAESTEFVDIGRIHLDSLKPDSEYTVEFHWENGSRCLNFRTLPLPEGELLSSYAVFADPHVSLKPENRMGRLFVESASILRDVVADANSKNVEFTLIAGDLTNKGTGYEYALVASILKNLNSELLPVPGDHDANHPEGRKLWEKYFGELQWSRTLGEYAIVGLDSADNSLDDAGAGFLKDALSDERRFPLVVSHLQLVDNPRINIGNKQKIITERSDTREMIELFENRRALFYAGHQNIPARVAVGASLQVNVPQTNQYICGYYWGRRYENGFYHTLVPISSDILQQYSRTVSNAAAITYDESQWNEDYREGGGAADFLF